MSETANPTVRQMKWTHVKWKRVAVGVLYVFACLGALLLVMWFLEPWYFAREMSQIDAHLAVTPVALQETSRSALAPGTLAYFDFSFHAPWKQIETQKVTKSSAVVLYKEGAAIIIFDPGEMTSISTAVHQQSEKLAFIFGPRAMRSGYDWMASELAATPDQIRWWNRTNNVRLTVLLGMKSIEMTGNCTAIYKAENSELHGFQLGDPAIAPHRVTLDLFDVNNRRYELVASSRNADHPVVTQADINAIVASIRPVLHS